MAVSPPRLPRHTCRRYGPQSASGTRLAGSSSALTPIRRPRTPPPRLVLLLEMSHEGAEGNGELLIANSVRRAAVSARATFLLSWLHPPRFPVDTRQSTIAAI